MDEKNNEIEIITNNILEIDLNLENIENEHGDCSNLEIDHANALGNSNINVEGSKDVVIGNITQFHGPVTIYQNQNTYNDNQLEKCALKENSNYSENTGNKKVTNLPCQFNLNTVGKQLFTF